MMRSDNTIRGGLLCATGYVFLASMSAVSKYLQQISGMPAIELTFFSYFCVFLGSLPWIVKTGIKGTFTSPQMHLVLTRTILGVLTYYLYFVVVNKMPLVTAVTLINTAPFWVAVIAAIVLKERVSKETVAFIVAGFIGVLFVVHPTSENVNVPAVLLALVVGVLAASVIVCRRSLKNESWQRIVAVYSFVAALLSGIFMIPVFVMPKGIEWAFVVALGVSMYIMQAFIQLAARYAKASTLGPISYTSIVVSGFIGWLVWGHVPSPVESTGIFIIVVSGIIIIMIGKKEEEI